ncbi:MULTISPECIES: type VII secretion protein EccB [unclassified Micromonospora]|uniref:type VII secretion protein EccB n=1 Tax=unclassified Micromonospora TaxID=2617518 RepID=UPI00249C401B|nr:MULTISPECIES: type VII secretion protein EccB [unclassified Micromonospora]WFE50549.1 type VII secretion protein EccB [Micromonospora sp. WMMD1155]WFF02617.1 type VII secretion protein EccB [Micromonospora sp. WMMD964]
MRTRRDQVQAYRFVTRRIVSALLSGDPETTNLPMRRLGMAVFGSVITAAVVLGGVGAYGQLTGNTAPLEDQTLVIERETGATYVFLEGQLHPTLNYASARLILDQPDATARTMSQASLRDRPRGLTLGIVGAPDALPDRKSLTGLPWSVCDVPDPVDPQRSRTRVVIDRALPGGVPLGDRAALVVVDNQRYLVTDDVRLQVLGGDRTITALKMADVAPLRVGQQLLNAVPAGPPLRKPSLPGEGESSTRRVAGQPAKVGQVFSAAGRYYVLTREGLASISEITALLMVGGGGRITDITPNQAGELFVEQRVEEEGLPKTMPSFHPTNPGQTTLCATYRASSTGGPPTTTLEVFDRAPAELTATNPGPLPVPQTRRDAVRTTEAVLLPGGKGVIAQASPGAGTSGSGAAGSTIYLITPQGIRYPLGSAATLGVLGYGGVTPLAVPGSLLALIPTGPTLSREGAMSVFSPDDRTVTGADG